MSVFSLSLICLLLLQVRVILNRVADLCQRLHQTMNYWWDTIINCCYFVIEQTAGPCILKWYATVSVTFTCLIFKIMLLIFRLSNYCFWFWKGKQFVVKHMRIVISLDITMTIQHSFCHDELFERALITGSDWVVFSCHYYNFKICIVHFPLMWYESQENWCIVEFSHITYNSGINSWAAMFTRQSTSIYVVLKFVPKEIVEQIYLY